MNPGVNILVLNWNGGSLTLDCLASLEKVTYQNYRVTVIDNHSTDDSVERIRAAYPETNIITLDQNYGYGGGYNHGIALLQDDPADYYILLNNDTLVDPNFLDCLVEAAKQYGRRNLFGPKIFYADQPDRIWYAGGRVALGGIRIWHEGIREQDSPRYSRDKRTDYITGCCLMITPALFAELGGFDEDFKLYAEDVDLCLRARQKGMDSYLIPSARIWHRVSASTGGNLSLRKNLCKLKSRLTLIRKHGVNLK